MKQRFKKVYLQQRFKNIMSVGRFFNIHLDFVGIGASMICAVHCMALPLLSSLGLMSVGHHHSHTFDFMFLLTGLGIAAFSFFKDFRNHNNGYPSALGIVGFVSLYYGITSHHVLFSVLGGLIISAAHITNYMYNRTCKA